MDRRLREQLNIISDMLEEPTGQKLWNVLTALRGPDSSNVAVKKVSTARIRARAFPKLANGGHMQLAGRTAYMTTNSDGKPVITETPDTHHFNIHNQYAADALKDD